MRLHSNILNTAANIALLAASATLGALVWQKYSHLSEPAQLRETPFPFTPGSRAPALRSVDYSAHEMSLVIFLSTTCHYCISSIPFYNRLQYIARTSHQARALYAVFRERDDAVAAFKTRLNLDTNSLASLDFRGLGVHSTPTALLVNQGGTVKRLWIGASGNIESAILSQFQVAKPSQ